MPAAEHLGEGLALVVVAGGVEDGSIHALRELADQLTDGRVRLHGPVIGEVPGDDDRVHAPLVPQFVEHEPQRVGGVDAVLVGGVGALYMCVGQVEYPHVTKR